MNIRSSLLAVALVVGSALSAQAATYNIGVLPTDGVTAQNTLVRRTVDFINFTLDAPSGMYLHGLNITVTSTAGSNFSEMIALYSGSTFIKSASAARGGGNGATLTFDSMRPLAEGGYTLVIGGWVTRFDPDIANVRSSANFRNGAYTANITPTFAAIPLPAGGMLLISALAGLVWLRRRQRAA